MRTAARVIAVTVAVLLGAAGCDSGDRIDTPPQDRHDVAAGADEALLIALAEVRNFHRQADVQLANANHEGAIEAAIEALIAALAVPFPDGAEEAQDVRLDVRARLATVYLAAGRPADAERVAVEGIAAASRESFFLANLHAVKGEILEARGDRRGAIEARYEGQQMNLRLQRKLLKEQP